MGLSTWRSGCCGAALSLLLLAACWRSADAGYSWHKCDDVATYRLDPWDVHVTPDDIKPRDTMVFDINATVHDAISGGKFELKVYWGWVRVYTASSDICSAVADASCPLAPDTNVTLQYVHTLPGDAPHGTYKAKMHAVDAGGASLNCFEIDFGVSSSGEHLEETLERIRANVGLRPT